MAYEVILPKLGQTVEEGRIVEWLKAEGDEIQRGDVLFTVETDKAVLDVESKRKGYLRRVLADEGELLPVLTVVGIITRTEDEDYELPEGAAGAEEGEAPEAEPQATEPPPQQTESPPKAEEPLTEVERAARVGRIFASPRARKYAREHGVEIADVTGTGPNGRIIEQDVIDFLASMPKASPVAERVAQQLGVNLREVTGTGPRGRIVKADVLAAAEAQEEAAEAEAEVPQPEAEVPVPAPTPVPEAAAGERVPLTGVRRVIAERLHASHTTTAPVTLTMEVDATDFVAARERLKANLADELGFNIGYNDLLIKVAARALRRFPYVNARLVDDEIVHLDVVNVGLAIDTERGLLVPNVPDADEKSLVEVATTVRNLVDRARKATLTPDDFSGGTFTITNLGMYEVDTFTPIINAPEIAILGVGRIKAVPAVVDGEVAIRQRMWLSLTFDHRLVDGAPAARFLQYIKRLIEEPYLLLA
jgi:pyruvate dehydrogenase E2 component (dihydrolipoamide acetyltransferase)